MHPSIWNGESPVIAQGEIMMQNPLVWRISIRKMYMFVKRMDDQRIAPLVASSR